jgi:uncharacterized protein YecT (DUF1311 family)
MASPVFAVSYYEEGGYSAWDSLADRHYRNLYRNCLVRHEQTNNASVWDCSNEVQEKAEAEMGILYGQFLSYLTAEDEKYDGWSALPSIDRLTDAQEAWKKYRDNHCTSMTIRYMAQAGFCPMLLTIDRVSELRALLGVGRDVYSTEPSTGSDEGTFEYEGGVYTGEVSDGSPHGQGTFTYVDGDIYVGQWKEGYKHGQGTYTSTDGDNTNTYVGEWKEGYPWSGTFWEEKDKSVIIGTYSDGVFERRANIQK